MDVVSYNLSKTPTEQEGEKSSSQEGAFLTVICPVHVRVLLRRLRHIIFHLLPSTFPKECPVPARREDASIPGHTEEKHKEEASERHLLLKVIFTTGECSKVRSVSGTSSHSSSLPGCR